MGIVLCALCCLLTACNWFNRPQEEPTDAEYFYRFSIDGIEYAYKAVVDPNSEIKSFSLYENGTKMYDYALQYGMVMNNPTSDKSQCRLRLNKEDGTLNLDFNVKYENLDRVFPGYDYYAGEYYFSSLEQNWDKVPFALFADGSGVVNGEECTYRPWCGNMILLAYKGDCFLAKLNGNVFVTCGSYEGEPFLAFTGTAYGNIRYDGYILYIKDNRYALWHPNDYVNVSDNIISFGTFSVQDDGSYLFSNGTSFTLDENERSFSEKPLYTLIGASNPQKVMYVYEDFSTSVSINGEKKAVCCYRHDSFVIEDDYYYSTLAYDAFVSIEIIDKDLNTKCLLFDSSDADFVGLKNARTYVSDAPNSTETYGIIADTATTYTVGNTEIILVGDESGTIYVKMQDGIYTCPAYYIYFYETETATGKIRISGESRSPVRFELHDETGTCTVTVNK